MREDFGVLIISHERANDLITLDTLKKKKYTGKYYIIIDDEDSQIEDYYRNFGEEHIVVFSKEEVMGTFDIMDNFYSKNTEVYARNVSFKIAREKGLKYFVELDEDYLDFLFRWVDYDEEADYKALRGLKCKDIEELFEIYVDFLEKTNVKCISFSQAGDFIGGAYAAHWEQHIIRKSMNSFFFKVPDDPKDDVQFLGRMNDDVNTYVFGGMHGEYWCQLCRVALNQETSQQKKTGLSALYKDLGTYVKSMYTVMLCPTGVKVYTVGLINPRIHHNINWNLTVPKLISDRWKK